jgi:nucleotidyltransferase substrate binding protein (TIGR01987 family)
MAIDLSAFRAALASLDRGLARAESDRGDEEVRDGVIQRFEYSYELAWKSLKRILEAEAASPAEVDGLSFRDLIRLGAEKGLVDDPTAWFGFREERNISSHTYDQAKAREVYAAVLEFAPAARRLLEKLAARAG